MLGSFPPELRGRLAATSLLRSREPTLSCNHPFAFFSGMGGKQYARASLPRAAAPCNGARCPIHSRFSANGWDAVRPCEPPASVCSKQWCAVPRPFASFLAEWVGSSTPVRASRELLLHAMVRRALSIRLLSGGMGGKQYARASLPRASAPCNGYTRDR